MRVWSYSECPMFRVSPARDMGHLADALPETFCLLHVQIKRRGVRKSTTAGRYRDVEIASRSAGGYHKIDCARRPAAGSRVGHNHRKLRHRRQLARRRVDQHLSGAHVRPRYGAT